MRVIVGLSGGKASAWCAGWALRNFPKEGVVFYFNDTKWEHRDLYRFIDDLSRYFDHPITVDSDGRSPEDLFREYRVLASSRMPFCTRILKAQRLQVFYEDGDVLVFGIDSREPERAKNLERIYSMVAIKTGKKCQLRFPLIEERVTRDQVDEFIKSTGILEPQMYRLGFLHNNCSGGCVRAGKRQWKMLYEKLPEVYAERERVERELGELLGKKVSFLRGETLEEFRGKIERKSLSSYYYDDTCSGREYWKLVSRYEADKKKKAAPRPTRGKKGFVRRRFGIGK